ncbi:ABC transporter G family member 10 like [Actinidia chinensis var. chinensis]|uniref:ABC transporter G family member 10 like n=1 Tax=Actinidia chinensis var. chinensis TaxID=1590841 RepID=A0A2R6QXI1_ACTCC|nr:ABC transporter G family member 10 like [Actinidia chinensis var. chinensis]
MELPVTAPDSGSQKTQYKIKTKNLSYKLHPQHSNLGWFGWWEEAKSPNRYILRNVNCEAKPGEITAITGPSGAGKTTLLDILAGMIVSCRVSGHVLVNDQPMNASHFRRVSGYVTQDEALFPLLTVEETLMYSARLRLHGALEKAKVRVTELMKELGLEHVAGMRIGSDTRRGISGGEKRRVSIGVDLVHDPYVLLIDEPTSGLDSASALHVVFLLKSMAKNQGKTIVLTIHQPGFRILEMFDKAVLLSNGIVLHHGSLHLLEERLKFAGHCIPRHVNVLEFSIDVIQSLQIDIQEHSTEMSESEEEYNPIWTISNLGNVEANHIFYPNSRFREVLILSQRFSKNVFRTKQLFFARTMQALLAGVVLGTIFMNANNDPKRVKLRTQIGFFAFSLSFLLSSTTEALPILLEERRVLMRETSRGAYRASSYVISNTLVFLPFLLIVALLYTTPVYWLVGLRRDIEGFLYFSLLVWIVVLMSNSFVACFSALVPNFIMGASLITGVMGSFFLFSGYFISKEDIPRCWIFMYYLSLFRYPYECFMINEFGGEKGKRRCLESVEGECLLDGNGFLLQQGLKESQKWSNLVVMLVFIFGYRLLCFIILWYKSYRMRS